MDLDDQTNGQSWLVSLRIWCAGTRESSVWSKASLIVYQEGDGVKEEKHLSVELACDSCHWLMMMSSTLIIGRPAVPSISKK
jgi:hypothetical protein